MTLSGSTPHAMVCNAFGQVLEAGVATPEALVASETLCVPLKQAMRAWFIEEAGRRAMVRQALDSTGVDLDTLASDSLKVIFRPWGYKDMPYPSLTPLLDQVRAEGPESAIPFMEKVLKWKVIGLHDIYRRRVDMLRVAHRLTDNGASDGPDLRNVWAEDACNRFRVGAVLTGLGRSRKTFLSDLFFLADVLGEKRPVVADALLAGAQAKYARGLACVLESLFGRQISGLLDPFLAQAKDFELPQDLRKDRDTLLSCIGKQDGAVVRARLAGRKGDAK